jgi:hypothetical protein
MHNSETQATLGTIQAKQKKKRKKGQFTSVEYKTSNKNILYRYSFSGRR